MNTPDTEWEKEELVRKAERDIEFVVSNPDMYTDISVQVKNIIRNAVSSRDTYWKARVRKEVEGMKTEGYCNPYTDERYRNDALDEVLQALENLK